MPLSTKHGTGSQIISVSTTNNEGTLPSDTKVQTPMNGYEPLSSVSALSGEDQQAHYNRLTMHYPCGDGQAPCRRAAIKNIANGSLPWHHTITHRAASRDAPDLYKAILKGEAKNVIGAVIRWS